MRNYHFNWPWRGKYLAFQESEKHWFSWHRTCPVHCMGLKNVFLPNTHKSWSWFQNHPKPNQHPHSLLKVATELRMWILWNFQYFPNKFYSTQKRSRLLPLLCFCFYPWLTGKKRKEYTGIVSCCLKYTFSSCLTPKAEEQILINLDMQSVKVTAPWGFLKNNNTHLLNELNNNSTDFAC